MSGIYDTKTFKDDVYIYLLNRLEHLKNATIDTVHVLKLFDSILETKIPEATEIVLGFGPNVLLGRGRKVTHRAENGDNIISLS
ncbi:hypothetical protein BWQ96_04688 [Gracilariopsis chorda]|uniref:Uncharacterized protein n=1 Tax=Gracilariopsis chorda TaxID=448386 RepID=A0A2V3IWN1_9FLOR|nr:hypothetical protein BWQ96_04688 [Gracilariopsis chorda]|eukprot:PXF45550.1 hypothetical protein BWQ96_04688 [Gracilariopsis chorda]